MTSRDQIEALESLRAELLRTAEEQLWTRGRRRWLAKAEGVALAIGHLAEVKDDGPQESARPSDGRTGPLRRQRWCPCGWEAGHTDARPDGRLCGEPGPTCGHRLGDMRCQLRRGHDGAHEDYRAVAQERRA